MGVRLTADEKQRRIKIIEKNFDMSLNQISTNTGIARSNLYQLCKDYGIDHPSFVKSKSKIKSNIKTIRCKTHNARVKAAKANKRLIAVTAFCIRPVDSSLKGGYPGCL